MSDKKGTVQINNLVTWRKDVMDTYAFYEREHALIEVACPALFVTNPYFEADVHNSFYEQYHLILSEFSTLEQVWHSQH